MKTDFKKKKVDTEQGSLLPASVGGNRHTKDGSQILKNNVWFKIKKLGAVGGCLGRGREGFAWDSQPKEPPSHTALVN